MIPPHIVDEIMQTARIEEVIGEFVQLKRSGSNYKGLSPFTSEKTPSFFVSPTKQIFKCFSSGKGGTVVSFLMEHEHFTYPEALRWLADKYGIEVPEEREDPAFQAAKDEREKLYVVNAFAQRFFTEQLWEGDEGEAVGLSYFRERGFSDDTIRKFQLGYCPEREPHLYQASKEAGHSMDVLMRAGLVKEKDGRYFDFFRARVMFPIQNLTGRVIAFGGRTLRTDKKIAKYFNSPETEIYHKSNVLYGIFQAKNAIVKHDMCYLVEGYTDVISMHQAGVENVVASSGTALTKEQIRLIRRYTPHITILYDGDPAGIKASFRGIDLILEEGMSVRVVLFPDGHDPDSFSKSVSTNELETYIKTQSQDFVSFKAGSLFTEAGQDPMARAEAIREIVNSIAHIPDSIARSIFIKECSERFGIPEQSLISHHNKARRELYKQSRPDTRQEIDQLPMPETKPVQPQEMDELSPQEREIVRLLLNYGDQVVSLTLQDEHGEMLEKDIAVADFIINELHIDDLELKDNSLKQILEEYANLRNDHQFPSIGYFAAHPNQPVRQVAVDLVAFDYTLSDKWEHSHEIFTRTETDRLREAVVNTVLSFKAKKISEMIKELQLALKASVSAEEQMEIQAQEINLKRIEMHLNHLLGRDIIR